MSRFGYEISTVIGRFCWFFSVRLKVIRPEATRRPGAYILACTHLSHIDPFLMSIMVRRTHINWMARIEFFKYRIFAWYMRWVSAIAVRRFGVPVSAIRLAIDRLSKGRVVGICPEGGVAQGKSSVMRGGPMKKGICLISCRTGTPVLPCIMLGTDKLNCVSSWLPFRRAKLWVVFGSRLVYPHVNNPDRRGARDAMAAELSREYQSLYAEAMKQFGLSDASVP
jgi:1-acyl-sn-glycerol-3-phosphate acyltransferase